MADEALAKIVEANVMEVARWTAEEIVARKIEGYSNYGLAVLQKSFVPTVEMVARYLRTDDVTEWRDYIVKAAQIRIQQGMSTDAVFQVTSIISSQLKRMIEREVGGSANTSTKDRYIRRVDSLTNLTKATILKTNLNKE